MNKTSAATAEKIFVEWNSGTATNQSQLGEKHGVSRSSTNTICQAVNGWEWLREKFPTLRRPAPVKSTAVKPKKPAQTVVESTETVDGEELSINIAADLLKKLPRANLKAILLLSKYATGEAQDLLTMIDDSNKPCARLAKYLTQPGRPKNSKRDAVKPDEDTALEVGEKQSDALIGDK